ncbi:17457_t:CDS:1, partial [Gigaspora rosea]
MRRSLYAARSNIMYKLPENPISLDTELKKLLLYALPLKHRDLIIPTVIVLRKMYRFEKLNESYLNLLEISLPISPEDLREE